MARASAARWPARNSLASLSMSTGLLAVIAGHRHWSSSLVIVTSWPRAAEDRGAFRRDIGLQFFPGHEGDIVPLGIGADRIGRIMEGETRALARLRRWRQRDRPDLEQFRLEVLVPVQVGGLGDVALFLFGLERGDHGALHRLHGRTAIGGLAEKRPDADALVLRGIPQDGVD